MLLKINPKQPEKELILQAVAVMKKGGVIVYPTDTIYGLGCDIYNKKAVERIYQIKKRKKKTPFSFICSDFKQIGQFAVCSKEAFRLMRRLLPGPYTFILKASMLAPRTVIEQKRRTVGVRIPEHPVCLALVKELGNPICTTSVNYSGEEPLCSPKEIEERLWNLVDVVLDGGKLDTEPSTIVDITGEEFVVVRQGKGKIEI